MNNLSSNNNIKFKYSKNTSNNLVKNNIKTTNNSNPNNIYNNNSSIKYTISKIT
jgi:hypothetical protein